MSDVAVVGGGSWGTGLACLLAARGHAVRLWVRDPELAERIGRDRVNHRYLPDVRLDDSIAVTACLPSVLADCGFVIVAVPSVGVPWVAEAMAPAARPGAVVISAAKGLDHETGRRMSVVLAEALGPGVVVGALSGPNLSQEVTAGQPSASVVAAGDPAAMATAQQILSSPLFRVYTNADLPGVELGGALKNPLAIAAGITDGLGYGDNSKAVLMVRGMHEIRRLGVALGAQAQTFSGLCGFGDLLATCHSRQSRNRNLGEQLGRGRSLEEAQAESRQVAEGVPTTRTAVRLAREHGVEIPIFEELHAVLFEGKPVGEAVKALMGRHIGDEFD